MPTTDRRRLSGEGFGNNPRPAGPVRRTAANVRLVFRRLAPVIAAGLVLAACGSGDGGSDAAPATTVAAPAPTAPPGDGGGGAVAAPAALQFSAPLVGGGDIELTTLAGRPVLLWFWAPW